MGRPPDPEKKRRLIEATLALIRKQGYAGTSVDDICAAAGVTRGSFFHLVPTKEAMALLALDLYAQGFREHFGGARLQQERDAVRRVHKYLDSCVSLAHSPLLKEGCFLGVLAQEIAATHPRLRVRCQAAFDTWVSQCEVLLVDAFRHVGRDPAPARSLATYVVALLEGSILLGRVHRDQDDVDRCLVHARATIDASLRA